MEKEDVVKKLIVLFFAICLLPISFVGCAKVTPIAYVTFKTQYEQVAVYTSHANSSYAHIYVFDNEGIIPNSDDYAQPADYTLACDSACALSISFKRNLGADTVNGTRATTCDIDRWQCMTVQINKSSETYAESKSLYLNGNKLVVDPSRNDSVYESEYSIIYYFENFGLKRGNPNGKINGVVNTLEYK